MATMFMKKACKETSVVTVTDARRAGSLAAVILMVLCLIPGCPSPAGIEEVKKEVEALKAEIATLKEKIIQFEAGQKVLMEMAKGVQQPKGATPGAPETTSLGETATVPGTQPATPLTPGELIKNKDQLIGTRVTVRGVPGPVLMHKKTLFLSAPQGMVEVLYGNLQDKKQVERLTAQTIETPVTVSGILSTAPEQSKGAVRLIIMADTVDF